MATPPDGPRQIIRDRAIVDDPWRPLPDDAALTEGDLIVSHARWRAEGDALADRAGRLGVRFPSTVNPGLEAGVEALALIAIEFPKFADGRGYSYARQLRDRRGFTGEIRAVGDILRDQLLPMTRCGFDSFELRADKPLEDALRAFDEFTVQYQTDFKSA